MFYTTLTFIHCFVNNGICLNPVRMKKKHVYVLVYVLEERRF